MENTEWDKTSVCAGELDSEFNLGELMAQIWEDPEYVEYMQSRKEEADVRQIEDELMF